MVEGLGIVGRDSNSHRRSDNRGSRAIVGDVAYPMRLQDNKHVTSYHILLYHTISYYIKSYHVISCYIILYHVISYSIILYNIVSFRALDGGSEVSASLPQTASSTNLNISSRLVAERY